MKRFMLKGKRNERPGWGDRQSQRANPSPVLSADDLRAARIAQHRSWTQPDALTPEQKLAKAERIRAMSKEYSLGYSGTRQPSMRKLRAAAFLQEPQHPYDSYMSSPRMSQRRQDLIDQRGKRCSNCFSWQASPNFLRLRHSSFDSLFDELDEHLSLVCAKCLRSNDPINAPNLPDPYQIDSSLFIRQQPVESPVTTVALVDGSGASPALRPHTSAPPLDKAGEQRRWSGPRPAKEFRDGL